MKNPTVHILCGVHNYLEYTKELLKCIDGSDYKKVKSIIIDDGSTDGTIKYIKEYYPKTVLLHGDGDLWWTGAMEKGVNYVLDNCNEDDYILTINNDCTFKKNYIRSLVSFVKDKTNTVVGSLVLDKTSGKIVDAGVRIDWGNATFKSIALVINDKKHPNYVSVDTLSTKGTLFPVKVFKEIGNFDKANFPHYLSDYEFTCRAKKNGYSLEMNYNSVVLNDQFRTGREFSGNQKIDLKQFKDILFSKKSKINIFDQIRFFLRYCPGGLRIQCVLSLFKKTINLLSLLEPNIY